jgi:hypothetical protein
VRPDLIVVTAASSNHFGPLRYMLESLRVLQAHVECYDLGLTPREVSALPRWDGVFYRRFDYAACPAYMNVAINAGEYAWKPVIVAQVVDAVRSLGHSADVLWADAGCYFHALDRIAERIRASDGLWVRTSSGTMIDWTHPLTFEYLKGDSAQYGPKPNADATLVGFATGSQVASVREAVYDDIVVPWKACVIVAQEPSAGSGRVVVPRSQGRLPVRDR